MAKEISTKKFSNFEFMLLLKHGLSSDDCGNLIQNISTLLSESGGSVVKHKKIGIIPFAYPIKKRRKGMCLLLYINADIDGLERVRGKIKYEDRTLRHIIVKIPTIPEIMPEVLGLRIQN